MAGKQSKRKQFHASSQGNSLTSPHLAPTEVQADSEPASVEEFREVDEQSEILSIVVF